MYDKIKNYDIDEGFVYVGRLIDHNGNFITSYYKLGKTVDFKIRETNLNSTHMPLDVQFIRVFETKHMTGLEKVLHTCFDEYRVVKEYEWRRNITTEWFDVSDDDLLESKIDTIAKYFPNTNEIDLISKIKNDTGTSITSKVNNIINNINQTKRKFKLVVTLNGQDISNKYAADTMVDVFLYVCDKVGYEVVSNDEIYFTKNKQELVDRYKTWSSFKEHYIRMVGEYYLMTILSNDRKSQIINGMINRYGLTELTCEVEEIL